MSTRPGRLQPAHETICTTVLTAGPVISPHAPVEFPDRHLAAELGMHTYAGVPVRTPDGNVIGSLCAVTPSRHRSATGPSACCTCSPT